MNIGLMGNVLKAVEKGFVPKLSFFVIYIITNVSGRLNKGFFSLL